MKTVKHNINLDNKLKKVNINFPNEEVLVSNSFYKISFYTTCMNRLDFLKKTLIQNINDNIEYKRVEFVLLNYNSKDDLDNWINLNCKDFIKNGMLKYYKTSAPEYFERSHAKNCAAKFCTGDIISSVDADVFTGKDFAEFVNYKFQQNQNIIIGRSLDGGMWDKITLKKEYFEKIRGYDEQMSGWGFEDVDMSYRALMQNKLKKIEIPEKFVKIIQHSDIIRVQNEKLSKQEGRGRNSKIFKDHIDNNIFIVNKDIQFGDLNKGA